MVRPTGYVNVVFLKKVVAVFGRAKLYVILQLQVLRLKRYKNVIETFQF